jgi:hypothetical protein
MFQKRDYVEFQVYNFKVSSSVHTQNFQLETEKY